MAVDKIEFFGAADRKGKTINGEITSEYPAWYLDNHVEELQRDIDRIEGGLKAHTIPDNSRPQHEAELKSLKERQLSIINSKPRLSGKDKDTLSDLYKDLVNQVSDSMFTRSEMMKGLASAHEEARRMVGSIINVGDNGQIFMNMGITPIDGKVSRNQASRAIKIIGRLLGEPTNIEYFRKDRSNGTYQNERSWAEIEGN